VIIGREEILITILKPNFRRRIDVDHATDFFVDAQKLSRGHELLADLIGRDPELHDRFTPTVLFSTAINGIELRRFDLRQMIASVNPVAPRIHEQQRFIRRTAQLSDKILCSHNWNLVFLRSDFNQSARLDRAKGARCCVDAALSQVERQFL